MILFKILIRDNMWPNVWYPMLTCATHLAAVKLFKWMVESINKERWKKRWNSMLRNRATVFYKLANKGLCCQFIRSAQTSLKICEAETSNFRMHFRFIKMETLLLKNCCFQICEQYLDENCWRFTRFNMELKLKFDARENCRFIQIALNRQCS